MPQLNAQFLVSCAFFNSVIIHASVFDKKLIKSFFTSGHDTKNWQQVLKVLEIMEAVHNLSYSH
ncbi:hypothetical protein ACFLTP_04830 [Chloroflexota bacterium]